MLRLLVLLALVSIPTLGRAGSFTPDSAVAHALKHNPDLIAARHSIAEAEGRLMHAGRLANPEIELEIKPSLAGREFSAGIGLVQKLPLARRLRFEKNLSQAHVTVAQLEVREAERGLEIQVRTLAVKLLDLEARRGLQLRRASHSRELATAASRAAAIGEGSSLVAAEFELEAGEIEAKLLHLEAEQVALTGALRPLLGLVPSTALALSGSLAVPEAEAIGKSTPDVTTTPGYQAAQARIEAANKNLELQHVSKWEDIEVGLGYEREHVDDAGFGMKRENFIGLKVSIPLPLGANNLSHIREAEATAHRRGAEATALAASLRAEAATARAEMAAAAAAYRQTSTLLLPKARQLEDRFFAAYQSGQAPLTDVLRTREKRLALEAAGLDARRDFNLARVRYEAAVGR